jgi:hypothetical protein
MRVTRRQFLTAAGVVVGVASSTAGGELLSGNEF